MAGLGVAFVALVLAETVTGGSLGPWFEVTGWALWAAFAGEFALRAAVAPSARRFLRRNWWQLVFLALPFLRFLRVTGRLARLRPSRIGRRLPRGAPGGAAAGAARQPRR